MVCHLNGIRIFENSVTRLIVQTESSSFDEFLPISIPKEFPMYRILELICIIRFKVEYTYIVESPFIKD